MVQKTKIIHITQGFGGLFTYIKQIIQESDREKFDIEIIAPHNIECKEFCDKFSVKYIIIELERGFSPLKDLSGLQKLYSYLKKSKPDLVHVHSAKAGFLGRLVASFLGIKSIYTPHGISYLSFTGLKRMIFFMLEIFAKKHTQYVLACSESEKIRCLYEIGIPEKKITVIENAIIVNDSSQDKLIDCMSPHIGVIARLTYQKNPILFVEIAKKIKEIIPQAKFSILGAGIHDHLINEVTTKIEEYGLKENFKIHQWGSFSSSSEYLKTLDIFLMTSVFEGLPFSLLEAMNENVLCITSKCDGCNDVINNNENGFSCMVLEDYVKCIIKAMNNPELSHNLRIHAKKDLKEKYNLDNFISKLENYYLTVKNQN